MARWVALYAFLAGGILGLFLLGLESLSAQQESLAEIQRVHYNPFYHAVGLAYVIGWVGGFWLSLFGGVLLGSHKFGSVVLKSDERLGKITATVGIAMSIAIFALLEIALFVSEALYRGRPFLLGDSLTLYWRQQRALEEVLVSSLILVVAAAPGAWLIYKLWKI